MMKIFLFLTILLSGAPAFANYIMFGPPQEVTATVTSTKVLNANNLRSYVIIVNTGSQTAIVKFATDEQDSATDGIPIPAGGNYEPFQAPSNPLWVQTASSTTSLIIVEGQ